MPWSRDEIAARAAAEVAPGQVVNLSAGLPSLVADHLDATAQIVVLSENGLLGVGPKPLPGKADILVTNASGDAVTVRAGGAFFDISESFAMIRSGHVDVCVLDAQQVDQDGSLAGWMIPGDMTPGFGGAMDLAVGARRVIVTMMHLDRSGASRLVTRCSLPLTAIAVVDTVITDLGVFKVADGAFHVVELAPGTAWADVMAATTGSLAKPPELEPRREPELAAEPAGANEYEEEEGDLVGDSQWAPDEGEE